MKGFEIYTTADENKSPPPPKKKRLRNRVRLSVRLQENLLKEGKLVLFYFFLLISFSCLIWLILKCICAPNYCFVLHPAHTTKTTNILKNKGINNDVKLISPNSKNRRMTPPNAPFYRQPWFLPVAILLFILVWLQLTPYGNNSNIALTSGYSKLLYFNSLFSIIISFFFKKKDCR